MSDLSTRVSPSRLIHSRTFKWFFLAFSAVLLGIVAIAAISGISDPSDPGQSQTQAQVIVNSSVIVFREGLEAVLIFAAVIASFVGVNKVHKKPVIVGAGFAFVAAIGTWFIAQAIINPFRQYADQVQAITGLLAIGVLLVILNWFLHKVYWTNWISRHHQERKRLLQAAGTGILSGQVIGFMMLGFTSVYREGFEVVLFLQTLQVKAGTPAVVEGVVLGLVGTAVVGVLTFMLHRKLPYKRMLILTGVLIGFVLVVMVGGTALTLQDLGWLPSTPLGISFPPWMATWFELRPTVEALLCQLLAAIFVIGSYFLAEHMRVRRPKKRGEAPAVAGAMPTASPVVDRTGVPAAF